MGQIQPHPSRSGTRAAILASPDAFNLTRTPVIIPSRKLPSYFPTVVFPVAILEEKGRGVVELATRERLIEYIRIEAVIGVGSWNRIRHFRVNRPIHSAKFQEIRSKRRIPMAEACKTVFRLPLPEVGKQTLSFHARRVAGWRTPERDPIEASCL
jgi:hypothetical protein